MATTLPSSDFWSGKSVLLTGHTGFIGSWLSLWLHKLGAHVTGLALAPNTTPSLYEVLALESKHHSVLADICDHEALKTTIENSQPDIMLHLAAQPIVGRAHKEPTESWRVNAVGTVALLEALRECNSLKSSVIFTTDKVYDNDESGKAFTEDDPVGGFGHYDSSKGAAELAVRSFRQSDMKDSGVATIRAGNVIGGGDWGERRLIPDIARAFSKAEPLTLHAPQAIRPWQHVLEVVYATLILAEKLHGDASLSGPWNIGPEENAARTVSEVVTLMQQHWDAGSSIDEKQNTFPEAHLLRLNSDKAKKNLGWSPTLTIEDAIGWTVQWYQAYYAKQDMLAFSLDQLATFEDQL